MKKQKTFQEVTDQIEKELNQLYEMAQKQGKDKNFVYYTLDNELASHKPHVHICVPKDDKHWGGNNFKNGQNLKTVGSIFLPYEQLKNKIPFTPENIQFEVIDDEKITGSIYVKGICDWLNSETEDTFGNKINNAIKCFNDYKMSNGDTCIYLKQLGLK